MEEIKNNQSVQGYYKNKKQKVVDFLIGFFGSGIIIYLPTYLLSLISNASEEMWAVLNYANIFAKLAFYVFFVIYAVKAKRNFIVWGIIAPYFINFIFFAMLWGLCFFSR